MKMEKSGRPGRTKRSDCPVSSALDVFGDRWTLVVVRDLACGKTRFGELLAAPENIPTNILADRLKQLEAVEVIERVAYQERPMRYEYRLTEKGRDLAPVLQAMAEWGSKHAGD
ncbi:MAG: winged helix-turn-helix transcriptional regulator [Geminicoccaceae bacterium]